MPTKHGKVAWGERCPYTDVVGGKVYRCVKNKHKRRTAHAVAPWSPHENESNYGVPLIPEEGQKL